MTITVAYAVGVAFLIAAVFLGVLKWMDSPMAMWSLMSVVTSAYIFLPYTTPAGAAIFVLIAAGLFYLDVVIYTRRNSYLK
jgi:hypothetical protein